MEQSRTRNWTVLLLGGHSAAGKTLVAQRLGRLLGVPVAQVDDFRLVLQRVIPAHAHPELHFFLQPDVINSCTSGELCRRLIRVGQIMSEALEVVIAHHVVTGTPLILEGDGLVPALARQQVYDQVRVTTEVRAAFLVEGDQDQLLRNAQRLGRGGAAAVSEERRRWMELSWRYGRWLQEEAQRHGVPVLEARPWDTVVDRVLAAVGSS